MEVQKNNYLLLWNSNEVQSGLDIFIQPGSASEYGVYVSNHSQSIFKTGETIKIYIEPIGFAHKELFDNSGNRLYQINLTSNVVVFDNQGNQVQSSSIEHPIINSYNRITEHYITIPIIQES